MSIIKQRFSRLLLVAIIIIPIIVFTLKSNSVVKKVTIKSVARPTYKPVVTSNMIMATITQSPQGKLIQKLNNRQGLSPSDIEVRNKILSLLPSGQDTGNVYQSSNIVIDFIKSDDVFQAEILTTNITLDKQEAVSWFLSEGMSLKGICGLPLEFYLSFPIRKNITGTFNPLPTGC